jgi:gibberellin A4 carboxyl methyltransferase
VIEGGDQMIRSLVHALDLDRGGHVLRIADYGAGTGGTSVHAVKTAITAVRERDSETPVLAIHGDLPTNDFSQLFRIAAGRRLPEAGWRGGSLRGVDAALELVRR